MRRAVRNSILLFLSHLIAHPIIPARTRWRLYRLIGLDVERCGIFRGLVIDGRKITIGEGSFINTGVLMEGWGGIRIGKNVDIAPRVCILTSTHELGGSPRRAGHLSSSPVTIGNGSWLGAGAIILPGVTIGEGAVVAAGAVVRSDVASDTLVGGVPAQELKRYPRADQTRGSRDFHPDPSLAAHRLTAQIEFGR